MHGHIPHWCLQGDNNWGDDRALYADGQQWLNTKHIMGRVVGWAPTYIRLFPVLHHYLH